MPVISQTVIQTFIAGRWSEWVSVLPSPVLAAKEADQCSWGSRQPSHLCPWVAIIWKTCNNTDSWALHKANYHKPPGAPASVLFKSSADILKCSLDWNSVTYSLMERKPTSHTIVHPYLQSEMMPWQKKDAVLERKRKGLRRTFLRGKN